MQISIQLNPTDYVFCGIKNAEQICEIYTIKDKSDKSQGQFYIDAKKLVSNTTLPLMQPYVINNTIYYKNFYDSKIWTSHLSPNADYLQSYEKLNGMV